MDKHPIEKRLETWLRGFDSEIKFWEYWFASKGAEWPEDYKVRLDPNREFPSYLLAHLPEPRRAKILDVGSGPVTSFGFNHNGEKLDLVACDPLAPFYRQILAAHGIRMPVEPDLAFAEELSSFYEPNSFDLITCSNALDHSFEPLRGIEEMLIVAKPGGVIILTHRINEAVFGRYTGLHQWNFDGVDGAFVIWNKEQNINVNAVISPWAEVKVDRDDAYNYITATLTKRPDCNFDLPVRYRKRIAELLPATMTAVHSFVRDGLLKPSTFADYED